MTNQNKPAKRYSISPQQIVGGIVVALILIFFIENWSALFESEIELKFIFPTVSMSFFWWLVILVVLGTTAGFLLGRERYKRRGE